MHPATHQIMKLIALLLSTTVLAQAELNVTVGDISDKRTTGKFFAGLEVDLKVSGPETADCKGIRIVVKDAKDDTGKAIAAKKGLLNDGSFKPLQKAFGGFSKSTDKKSTGEEYQLKLELENPARSAKSFTLDATVELLVPSRDPKSILTVDVAAEAGKPLALESLKSAGATITLKAPKDEEVSYSVSDPNGKVSAVEFCSADGKPLETNGRMSSGFAGSKSVTINLRSKAPAGTVAKIYLLTDKSVISVPLKLPAMTLP